MKIFGGLPKSSLFVLGNEAAERFSYYGMRAILTVYMINYLILPEHEALSYYHLFMSVNYFFPLLGAFVADRYLGKYNTIMLFSVLYCFGHLFLSVFDNFAGLMLGLGFIALGSGGIKPCVSAFLGDQFKKDEVDLKTKAFSFFYFSINFGSFFSSLLIPITKNLFGFHVAFAIPGILMLIATIILFLGRKSYTRVKPEDEEKSQFFAILKYSFCTRKEGKSFFAKAYEKFNTEEVEGVISVLNVLKIYLIIIVFWALFDQQGSSWVLQARKMDLNFFGLTLEPEMLQAMNPIMVMCLIPLCVFFIYPTFKLNPIRRMGIGMFIAGLSFVSVGIIEEFLVRGVKLNAMWQFIPYIILTLSEVFVSITGLEFAYTQAPKSMKSILTSLWLLTVFFGNMLTSTISAFNVFEGPMFFYFFGLLSIAVCLPYYLLARGYKIRNF